MITAYSFGASTAAGSKDDEGGGLLDSITISRTLTLARRLITGSVGTRQM